MRPRHIFAIACACAALGLGTAADKSAKPASDSSTAAGQTMWDMMGRSRASCAQTRDSLQSLAKTVREAIKSNDKAKMKAALQQADAHFSMMETHMATCVNMSDRMGGMLGGGRMRGSMMGDSAGPGYRMRDSAMGGGMMHRGTMNPPAR
jgi:hypothetical protein